MAVIGGDLQQRVRAHRMADADRACKARLVEKARDIACQVPPIIDRPAARLPVPAHVDGVDGMGRKVFDDGVEHPSVKPGRMGEDQWRGWRGIGHRRPFMHRQINAIDGVGAGDG